MWIDGWVDGSWLLLLPVGFIINLYKRSLILLLPHRVQLLLLELISGKVTYIRVF